MFPCRIECKKPIHRVHTTCLRCWIRRWLYTQKGKEELIKIDKLQLNILGQTYLIESKREPFILPRNFKIKIHVLYGNHLNITFIDENSCFERQRNLLLEKCFRLFEFTHFPKFLSLCEWLARW